MNPEHECVECDDNYWWNQDGPSDEELALIEEEEVEFEAGRSVRARGARDVGEGGG